MAKKISVLIMAVFYVAAGINHFNHPEAYYKIIPPFFQHLHFINICSGIVEIGSGLLLFMSRTRKFACYSIICMLIAFIPAHIYMIKTGWCIKSFCLPQWMIWARLILLQPLLILWAWTNKQSEFLFRSRFFMLFTIILIFNFINQLLKIKIYAKVCQGSADY